MNLRSVFGSSAGRDMLPKSSRSAQGRPSLGATGRGDSADQDDEMHLYRLNCRRVMVISDLLHQRMQHIQELWT
jgi:hypothetical protein